MFEINALRERINITPFSVTELNEYIKTVFENDRALSSVTVSGEISNFTNHRSGHLYFSLKDAEGQIRAVMFRSRAIGLKFMPESGMKVIVHGSVTVYPRDGSYQIYVSSMQPDGIGALYLAYEQLKARLASEGLFDPDHKLDIPAYPKRIGVITSPTGAAVRDIINVTGRRYPGADVYVYPALVQGAEAEDSLIKAVDYFDRSKLCDVVIIGRGGGSIEDLWAFNGERLARRIYESTVPIISAVGHETDFTICDFVADLRAPTPSAAAEISVPDRRDLLMRVDSYEQRLSSALNMRLSRSKDRLDMLKEKADERMIISCIESKRDIAKIYGEKASLYLSAIVQKNKKILSEYAAKAHAMSPLSTLYRGYSLAEIDGRIIRSVKDARVDDKVTLILSDGKVKTKVIET